MFKSFLLSLVLLGSASFAFAGHCGHAVVQQVVAVPLVGVELVQVNPYAVQQVVVKEKVVQPVVVQRVVQKQVVQKVVQRNVVVNRVGIVNRLRALAPVRQRVVVQKVVTY